MSTFSRRFTEWLIARRGPLLVLGAVVAVAAFFLASQLRFDRSIEKMFAADDPLLPPYNKLKEKFGGNRDS